MEQTMKITKFLHGRYRVSGEHYFSNVTLSGKRGTLGCWSADIRRSDSGDLVQYAGLWDTKRDAVDEAKHIIARMDALFVPWH
jgi:hypothetical protein